MIKQEKIIKWMAQKHLDGDMRGPINLGTEQRFVGALRAQPCHNLEEELLLGHNCRTSRYTDNDGNLVEERSFYTWTEESEEPTESYYKLTTTYFSAANQSDDYVFNKDNHSLVIRDKEDEPIVRFGDEDGISKLDTFFCLDPDIFKENEGNKALEIYPDTVLNTEETALYFINVKDKTSTMIAKKTTRRHFAAGKEIIDEVITMMS